MDWSRNWTVQKIRSGRFEMVPNEEAGRGGATVLYHDLFSVEAEDMVDRLRRKASKNTFPANEGWYFPHGV